MCREAEGRRPKEKKKKTLEGCPKFTYPDSLHPAPYAGPHLACLIGQSKVSLAKLPSCHLLIAVGGMELIVRARCGRLRLLGGPISGAFHQLPSRYSYGYGGCGFMRHRSGYVGPMVGRERVIVLWGGHAVEIGTFLVVHDGCGRACEGVIGLGVRVEDPWE